MASSIRGDKGHVRILRDGATVAWLELTGFTFQEDAQNTETFYIGRKTPETDKNHMGWSGSLSGEVKNSAIDELIQVVNDSEKAGSNQPEISLVLITEFPDSQTKATYAFTDVRLTYSGYRQGGVNEKTTKDVSFKAGDMRILPQ